MSEFSSLDIANISICKASMSNKFANSTTLRNISNWIILQIFLKKFLQNLIKIFFWIWVLLIFNIRFSNKMSIFSIIYNSIELFYGFKTSNGQLSNTRVVVFFKSLTMKERKTNTIWKCWRKNLNLTWSTHRLSIVLLFLHLEWIYPYFHSKMRLRHHLMLFLAEHFQEIFSVARSLVLPYNVWF